ncbi:MAG TPA: hypothetical protein VF186_10025 [Gaiellaceae bacterium]
MRRAALVALAAMALAPAASAETVRGAVSPATVRFGDLFRYTVEVRAPRGAGDVHVFAGSGVFDQVGAPATTRSTDGGQTVVRVTQTLACLARGCVPEGKTRRVALTAPRASVGGRLVAGSAVTVDLEPRVPAAAVSAPAARYRRQTALPPVSSRLPFDAAAAAAVALAVVLAAAAAALVALELRGRRKREAAVGRGGLELALRLLRESASRPVPDRRRAADYVSRLVSRDVTAEHATRVAWSRPEPDVTGLADEVERTGGGGR